MAKRYVLVYERALESVFCIGPFDSIEDAEDYAHGHHDFPQVWRHAELHEPEEELGPETA